MFSHAQQVSLAVVPKITGSLSLLGSLWIIVEVATDRLKRANVYHRLLLGMSMVDLFSSIAMASSTWPIPKVHENAVVVWAMGSDTSCTIQGFAIQIGIASPVYNANLALYYLIVCVFGWDETSIKQKVELPMHIAACLIGLITAIWALYLNLFEESSIWCWIGSQYSWKYRFYLYFGILWVCLIFTILVLVWVNRSIQERHMQAARQPFSSFKTSTTRSGRDLSFMIDSSKSLRSSPGSSPTRRRRSRMRTSIRRSSSLRTSVTEDEVTQFVEALSRLQSNRDLVAQAASDGSKSVYHQAVFYGAAFTTTYFFATVNRLHQNVTGTSSFVLLLLHVTFMPLQGLLNWIVYRRNAYQRLKQRHPYLTSWKLLYRCLRWSFLGPPDEDRKDDDRPHAGGEMSQQYADPPSCYTDIGSSHLDLDGVCGSGDTLDNVVSGYSDFPSLLSSSDPYTASELFELPLDLALPENSAVPGSFPIQNFDYASEITELAEVS